MKTIYGNRELNKILTTLYNKSYLDHMTAKSQQKMTIVPVGIVRY